MLDGLGNALGYTSSWCWSPSPASCSAPAASSDFDVLPLVSHGGWYEPNGLMLLAPSAFFLMGLLIWRLKTWKPELQDKDE